MLIVVHSGAGYHATTKENAYKELMESACTIASRILEKGGDACEGVQTALTILENDPLTNAGFGSNLTFDGHIECDASIAFLSFDSDKMEHAAIACAKRIKNPICAAIRLLNESREPLSHGRERPIFLVGQGADEWAASHGLNMVSENSQLISKTAKIQYTKFLSQIQETNSEDEIEVKTDLILDTRMDTVGAICIDLKGNIAIGSSSGGIALKYPGRVGQASCVGSGSFIKRKDNNIFATCATGTGEPIMKSFLSQTCCQTVSNSSSELSPEILKQIFEENMHHYDSFSAGILFVQCSLESHREITIVHSTPSMGFAYAHDHKKPKTVISRLNRDQPLKIVFEPI